MGRRHNGPQVTIGLFLAVLMLVGGPAASAFGFAKVRLANARPGSQSVGLKVVVGGAAPPSVGPASYGQVTPYVKVTAGSAQIALTGGGSANQGSQSPVDGGNYTAVAPAKGSKGFSPELFPRRDARKGTARPRVDPPPPQLGS